MLLHRLSPHLPLPLPLPLLHSFSSSSFSPHRHRHRRSPPPLSDTAISSAISLLPRRYSPSDLALHISSVPDPRLIPHLLSHALSLHPHRLLPHPDSPLPFLAALKRLTPHPPLLSSTISLALSLPLPHLNTTPHLNTILQSLTRNRLLSKSIYLYKRMRSSPDPLSRPDPTTYRLLFAALIGRPDPNSYINHIHMEAVRMLFRQMVRDGVDPDLFALNSVVKGYSMSLHLNDALRVFHQMGPVYGVEPDGGTYGWIVVGLCRQGRTRNARELFGEMVGKGFLPGRRVCNALVSALAVGGEVGEAVEVLWEVGRMGRGVDGITLRAVVEEVCRRGTVEEAVALVREMAEKEMVDGWLCRELMHYVQDEFGEGNDDGRNGVSGR